jgi:hypothetical protein
VTLSQPSTPLLAHDSAQRIPRTFHWVWLGGKPMPEEFVAFRRTWAEHHPDWQFCVWDESTLPPLRNQRWFDHVQSWSQKVDIVSFELLHRHGGIYLDTDFECLRNIEPLLDGVDVFAASEDNVHTCHGIMGCVPGHPLFERVIDTVEHSIVSQPDGNAAQTTGPMLLTRCFDAWRAEGNQATVFGPELFYPYHYTEMHRRHETFPDAYAAHHWTGSWLPENQPQPRRLVLVPDWDSETTSAAVLGAFCRIFAPGDPVSLVIACPAGLEQGTADRTMAAVAAAGATGELPDVWVSTFEETLAAPHDIAVVGGDPAAAARAVDWMAAVRAGRAGDLPAAGAGDRDALRLALAEAVA